MYTVIPLLWLMAASLVASLQIKSVSFSRIVGGEPAQIENYPWQVSLQSADEHFCGGCLYDQSHVISAAHCLNGVDPKKVKVRLGSSTWNEGGVLVDVAAIRVHEAYNSFQTNDVAVIRLATPVTYSSTIKNIALADQVPIHGVNASVSGWGVEEHGSETLSFILRAVHVNIVSPEICASDKYSYGNSIRETMICASDIDKDSCQGDSGGPLISGNRLVGIVSWGLGCGIINYPGVYADVFALRSWLIRAIAAV